MRTALWCNYRGYKIPPKPDIIGRTATLEVRKVDDDPTLMQQALAGNVPAGFDLLYTAGEQPQPNLVNKQIELTGDNINDAQPSFDENGAPAVSINLDSAGSTIFAELTRYVGKRVAMVLIDQGKAEVVTAPVIKRNHRGTCSNFRQHEPCRSQ